MAQWWRTWFNRLLPDGGPDMLLNSPDGWWTEPTPLKWLGSDQVTALLNEGGGHPTTWDGSTMTADSSGRGLDIAEPGNSFPAITRATSLICDTLAGTKWEVKRGRETLPTPRWITDPALAKPDLRISDFEPEGRHPLAGVQFWAQVLVSALWYGDAFLVCPNRAADGSPVPPMRLLHPLQVRVVLTGQRVEDTPEPGYWVRIPDDDGAWNAERWWRIPSDWVIHVPGMPPYWGGRGRGALTGHMRSWTEAVVQADYARGIFGAGVPAGYLKVTAPNLSPAQADALRDAWMGKRGRGRDIAVLNAVTEFHAVQLDPESMLLTDARKQSTLDVANAFGVEPFMLGLPSDNSTYANIESRMRNFVQFTLLPWARRIEGALSPEFATGTDLVIDLDSLTRADTNTRVDYYAAGLAGGWLTIDEVRQAEGMEPMPEGESVDAQADAISRAVDEALAARDDQPAPESQPLALAAPGGPDGA